MTGKLSKEEAAELRELATEWARRVQLEERSRDYETAVKRAVKSDEARAAFERRLAELTEG